jgi:hypothetical protein
MKHPLLHTLLVLAIFQLPGTAFGDPDLHYLGPLDSTVDLDRYSANQGDFVMGQRLPVAGYALDEMHNDGFPVFPSYYVVSFCPGQMPEVPCAAGWRIDAVHFVFASLALEPTELALRFDLAEGYPTSGIPQGLTLPWTEGTEALWPTVTVPGAGFYELVVSASEWECLHWDYWYGISQTKDFGGGDYPTDTFQYAVDDAFDHSCPDLRSWSMGELILFSALDLPGDLVMWVDGSCCENPVAVEALNWGGVKVRYR